MIAESRVDGGLDEPDRLGHVAVEQTGRPAAGVSSGDVPRRAGRRGGRRQVSASSLLNPWRFTSGERRSCETL